MIRISLGSVGSGKTACEVRNMFLNPSNRRIFSNIKVRKMKHVSEIKSEMIIKKDLIKTKKSRATGESEPVYKYNVNKEFWQKIDEPCSVILDEAHAIINSRRAMSSINICVTDWLSLIRRVLGQAVSGYGELVFITQLPNRIDIIAREMATQVRYHTCHYLKSCNKGHVWRENSEMPEPRWQCRKCGSISIKKHSHEIEVWHFPSMIAFEFWKDHRARTFYKHYLVKDIEKYFPLYDTLQWENLISDY